MTKFKRNMRAVLELISDRMSKSKKDLSSSLIGVIGSFLLLVFIVLAGIVVWLSERTGRA